jgi:hypothetical protein
MMIDLLVSAHEGILPAEPETRILKGWMVIRESTAPPPMV